MLKPDVLQRIVILGPRSRQAAVVAALHEQRVAHLIPFDPRSHPELAGFEPDSTLPGAPERARQLVRVRALLSRLRLRGRAPSRPQHADEVRARLAAELDAIEAAVLAAHDLLAAHVRQDEEDAAREAMLVPLSTLPLSLDDYSGYESLVVLVGRARAGFEDDVLEAAPESLLLLGEGIFALFVLREAAPAAQRALEAHAWERFEVPEGAGHPREALAALRVARAERAAARATALATLESLALEHRDLLIAAEEVLVMEADQDEAPSLGGGTTHAFLLEAWVPVMDLEPVEDALEAAAEEEIEIIRVRAATPEERRDAGLSAEWMYDHDGGTDPERLDLKTVATAMGAAGKVAPPKPQMPAGLAWINKVKDVLKKIFAKRRAVKEAMALPYDPLLKPVPPPTKYDNWYGVRRFQYFVNLSSTPRHDEADPTLLLALFLPVFFGFMIGDLGLGVLMVALGVVMMLKLKEIPAMKQVGVAIAVAGVVAGLFGALAFHDALGIPFTHHAEMEHELALHGIEAARCQDLYDVARQVTWTCLGAGSGALLGGLPHLEPPIHKVADVQTMLLLSIAAAAVHLLVALILGVRNALGPSSSAIAARASVVLLVIGLVPATMVLAGKPLGPLGQTQALALGAVAFVLAGALVLASAGRGSAHRRHLVVAKLGFLVLLPGFLLAASAMLGGPLGPFTAAQAYLVTAGATLVGGGMLAWAEGFAGVLEIPSMLTAVLSYLRLGAVAIAKAALASAFTTLTLVAVTLDSGAGILLGILGVVLFLFAQAVLFTLGVLSAGIQALRLNLVEFFTKFFVGGGEAYAPFGRLRRATLPPTAARAAPVAAAAKPPAAAPAEASAPSA